MNAKQIRITAAALAAAGLTLFVSACGDDSADSAQPTSARTSAAAPASPAPGGKSAALVGGKALDGKFETTCVSQGGVLALALTDTDNPTYGQLSVSATVTGDGTVQAVGIAGSKGGSSGMPYAVGYGNGQPGGSAKSVKDGNTYKVTGEGVAAPDMTNPMAGPATATFDITFACASIVNG
ncbi:lipoprotein LpqH [Nocardia wallacei]|uniref:lipoprotein LpqH n=1 Tax=Nocardia TaxID=1817 RepID=UPI0024565BA1|nr:lipoprotein LpqH [Nocardia wallacei]